MNVQEVITLVNAGFTKADILALAQPQDPQPQDPQPQDPQPQDPQPQDPQPQDPQPAAPAPDTNTQLATVLNSMQETLKQMQAANIAKSSNPEPKTTHEQAMEIMANIIAPPKKGSKVK